MNNYNEYIGQRKKSFVVIGIENIKGRNMIVLKCLDCGELKKVRFTRFLNEEFADCKCKSKPLDIGSIKSGFKVIEYTSRYNRFAYRIACTDCGKEYIVQKSELENGRNIPKCPCRCRSKRLRKVHKCDSLIGTILKDRNFLITEKVWLESGPVGVRLKCLRCGKTYDVDYRLLLTGRYGFCSCDDRYMKNKPEGALKKYSNLIGKTIGELTLKDFFSKNRYYYFLCDCSCGNKNVKISAYRLLNGLVYACPDCHLSFGGSVIKEVLNKYNLQFKTEVSFKDLVGVDTGRRYRFDFGIFSKDFKELLCLIEFDGPQHENPNFYISLGYSEDEAILKVEENKKRDAEKDKYCIEKNIPLLRIKYKRNKRYIIDKLLKFLNKEGVI